MFQKPTLADLRQAAHKLGMTPSDAYLAAVGEIITPLANAYAMLDATPDELPAVKYARGQIHWPTRTAPGTCGPRSRASQAASSRAAGSRSRTMSASPECR